MRFPIAPMENQVHQQRKYRCKKILVDLKNMNIEFISNDFLQDFIENGNEDNPRTNTDQDLGILKFSALVEKEEYSNDSEKNAKCLNKRNILAEEKYTYKNGKDQTSGSGDRKKGIGINVVECIHLKKYDRRKCDPPQKRCPQHRRRT